jgi:4-amino-4-deoxy-L-arabinose transferase-like glycosyltransferase
LIESIKFKNAFIPLFLFLLTIATRIPFSSKLLYHMDSVHFALALERYDLTVHQPHPPGYFLYVMLGRLTHYFIKDANAALVAMSIVFSALTVVIIYLLAEEMYDRKTGIIAAGLAITSPNLWFHGEIALTYGAEAFFSALAGLLCWKIYTGRYTYIWFSAIVLGVAGGFRQNTVVFLLPLLLFAVRKAPPWKIVAALILLGSVCIAWFIPMVLMTGGWDAYTGAFRELWEFSTGHNSVFDRGWESFDLYSRTLFNFTIYSIGAGICAIGLAIYAHVRQGGSPQTPNRTRLFFFAAWALPTVVFYLLIFIHPANPGYALISSIDYRPGNHVHRCRAQ